MEKYYGQLYYEKKYYICPNCRGLGIDTYLNFYNLHKDHISQFNINKKQLLKSILVNKEDSVPSKKQKLNETVTEAEAGPEAEPEAEFQDRIFIEISDDEDEIITIEDSDDDNWSQYEVLEEMNEEDMLNENVLVGGGINDIVIETDLNLCYQVLKINVSNLNLREIKIPDNLLDELCKIINELKEVKIQFGVNIEFVKEEEIQTVRISNKAVPPSDTFIEDGINALNEKIVVRHEMGSSWTLSRILEINFKITKVSNINMLSGHSYIPTPKKLESKKAILNIKNNDNKCFLYSILAVIKQGEITTNKCRASKYLKYMSELVFDEADMPMKLNDISKFERNNPGYSINVLSWNEDVVYDTETIVKHPYVDIIRRSKCEGRKIYLLMLENKNRYHYTAVLNLNRLLNCFNVMRIQSIWCENCLNGFRNELTFEKHQAICEQIQTGTTLYTMPTQKYLRFKDYSKMVTPPFVIYADFESVLPADEVYFQKHLPISAGLLLINNFTNQTKYSQFVGEDCIFQFLKAVEEISKNTVLPYYKTYGKQRMIITEEQENDFQSSTICYLCENQLRNPVRDHDHFTGQYLGAACKDCNVNRKIRIQLPVVFHNLRGYDMHHILKHGINKFPKWSLSCIPTTCEKFL